MRFLRPSCLVPVLDLLLPPVAIRRMTLSGRRARYPNAVLGIYQRPKHLDPARSYSGEDESVFAAQVYEAPLQYHYLKRPYTLIPAAAEVVPHPR